MDIHIFEEKVDIVLQKMEDAGYFAKKNRGTSPSCGWSGIPKARKTQTIFYCKEAWKNVIKKGFLLVCWSGDSDLILNTFKAEGLNVEWDGNPRSNMHVIFPITD